MSGTEQTKLVRFSGDRIEIPIRLRQDGATFNVPNTATVKAGLIKDNSLQAGPVTLSDSETGADWTTSLFVAVFPTTETAGLEAGDYLVEIEVTQSGNPQTYHSEEKIEIKTGYIS